MRDRGLRSAHGQHSPDNFSPRHLGVLPSQGVNGGRDEDRASMNALMLDLVVIRAFLVCGFVDW